MKVNTGMCVILTYVFSASLGLKQLTFQLQVKRSSSWGKSSSEEQKSKSNVFLSETSSLCCGQVCKVTTKTLLSQL